MVFKIGCHLSSSRGYLAMGQEALSIDANVFQFFSRNPRGGQARALDLSDVEAFCSFAQEHNIGPILAHAPYTLNAAAASAGLRQFAKDVFADDLSRLEHIPQAMYNFHPGSHVKQGVEVGIELIAEALNSVLVPGQHTLVLLETMSGKGSEVGGTFEQLRQIIDLVEHQECLGVCLDTCHVWDAGYDVVNDLDSVLLEFDRCVGLARLKAIHLNDGLNERSSHKDRHAKIGQGVLGLEALVRIINHPLLRNLPFYLETPNDVAGYAQEIALLRSIREENS